MQLTRRYVALAGAAAVATASLLPGSAAVAQSGDEAAVNAAIEALRKAMMDAYKTQLEELVADQLSYGHSGGVIETKVQFIDVIVSKKTVSRYLSRARQ